MAVTAKVAMRGNSRARTSIPEKGKIGGKLNSAGGLQNSFTGQTNATPKTRAPWDQNPVKNSLHGKGKLPLGGEKYTNNGASVTPVSKKSANVGNAMGGGSASSKSGVSLRGVPQGKSKANSPVGSKKLTAFITKKNSTTGQSQTIMKPMKQPKPTGVGVAKAINYHNALGFGGKGGLKGL